MEIDFVKVRKDAQRNPLDNSTFMADRVGFWGNVCDVDSATNTVSVMSDTGIKFSGLPVVSKEWVNKVEENNYVSGSRNLPQVGTHVFVLAPTHTAAGAFVLCSGYSRGEKSKQVLFSSKEDVDINNDIEESVNQSGWKFKEYYKNGNIIYENKDKTIHLEIINADDNDASLEKKILLNAYGNSLLIEENGITVIDKNKVQFVSNSNGIELYKNKDDTSKNYVKINNGIQMKGNSGTLEIK